MTYTFRFPKVKKRDIGSIKLLTNPDSFAISSVHVTPCTTTTFFLDLPGNASNSIKALSDPETALSLQETYFQSS